MSSPKVFLSSFFLVCLVSFSSQAATLPDFTDLVKNNRNAVVNISTVQNIKPSMNGLPPGLGLPEFPEGSPFGELFKRFLEPGGAAPRQRKARSLGSGFIISADGYILTNNHVIKDASEVLVRLYDRSELEATVIGTDARSDLALLKIDADNLPVASIGHSSELEVGEWVLAIGSPFGFEASATAGIVSAKRRALPNENYIPFIQTDVAINPGNSGGPLFNMAGEVVGINSQIYSRTGGYMGLSFSIPIDVAMDVAKQLKKSGHVSRGWLGVAIQDVTRDLAESFGMKKPQGALIAGVVDGGPAAEAGLQVGDVILQFAGNNIDTSSDLPPVVGSTQAGKTVLVKLLRDAKQRRLKVKIGDLPAQIEGDESSLQPDAADGYRLGLSLGDLTREQKKQLGKARTGVYVQGLEPGDAMDSGIRRGDVILRMSNRKIRNVKHFRMLEAELKAGDVVPVLVQRGDMSTFIPLRVTE
ncbi:MAG: DegQ family serine endoprotease [Gammaproteobacteria bacterium]|nr:DegQ family serine endoprotease [Gammaproteobacteria bacterium]